MSKIKLATYAAYRKATSTAKQKKAGDTPEPEILFGAAGFTRDKVSGNWVFTCAPLPLGPGQRPPEQGLTMLYGFRDTIDELKRRRDQARTAGAEFRSMEVEIEVGEIEVGLVDRKRVKDLKFVNLRRMTAALQSEILKKFSDYVTEEKKAAGRASRLVKDMDEDMSRVQQIAQRPDLFGRLLTEDRDLKGLEVLVIPIEDPEVRGGMRQIAYVRPKAKIISIQQSVDDDILALPKTFKNVQLAVA